MASPPRVPPRPSPQRDVEAAPADAAPDSVAPDSMDSRKTQPFLAVAPRSVNVELDPLDKLEAEQRYEAAEQLGEGGMGEVLLCRDRQIGRDVAMKVIRAEHMQNPEVRARFEREARVQGQLEHPAVVPVYDLGIRPGGAAFFTMKRVRGLTLEEIIDGLATGDGAIASRYSLRRLLGAFSNVCLAIAYTHARGVLHRDLKPGNIMLGEYGEVHVLDWGLAKIMTTEEGLDAIATDPRFATKTAMGQILGTPGYMAPEQLQGDIESQGPPSDVYALGAILFELLTLEPLHARPTLEAVFSSTLRGADARASARAPHRIVPPELEAVCVRATATRPEDRYSSALEMVEAIERYLDGDRDVERRRALAAAHAAAGARAAELVALGGEDGRLARERALDEVRAALAFDPRHPGALETLMELLLTAPTEMPPEARRELEASRRPVARASRSTTVVAYAIWLAFMLLALVLRPRLPYYPALVGGMALALIGAYWSARRRAGVRAGLVVHAIAACTIAILSYFMGPFIVVPGLAAIHAIGFVVQADRRYHGYAIATDLLAVCAPPVLQMARVLPPSYSFHDGAMTVLPRMTSLPPLLTPAFLILVSAGLVLVPTLMIRRVRAKMEELDARLFMHGWNLRQLVPDAARRAARMPGAPDTGIR